MPGEKFQGENAIEKEHKWLLYVFLKKTVVVFMQD